MARITKIELENRNTTLEAAIAQLNARLEKAAACWREQRAINKVLDTENQRAGAEIQRQKVLIGNLTNANKQQAERLQKAVACWREQRAEIAKLKNDLAAANIKIAELEAQISGTTTAA